ncbi:M3 family metallopeptidase [candidate division CSSED10-310 bacterium]|uniref:M3 family metallopeptidase n=1 Tax=candidate division CSSED10-310 bacterium TaxID=2855610 RepID=A0ABV6YVI7_UNCC1
MEKAQGVTWDLSFLYTSVNDARIDQDFEKIRNLSEAFVNNYQGKIAVASLCPTFLLKALQDGEEIFSFLLKPYIYSILLYSENTTNNEAQSLKARTENEFLAINNMLAFFENIELLNIPEDTFQDLIQAPQLEHYKYWLINRRLWKPYTRSEAEEQVLNLKNRTGRYALIELYHEFCDHLRFPFTVDGTVKQLSEAELASYHHSDDQLLRQQVLQTSAAVYKNNSLVITSIFNALINDHYQECQLRNISDVMLPAYLRDDVSAQMIEAMIEVVEARTQLVTRYYKLKAQLLNLPQLEACDIHVPLGEKITISFTQARETILEAFDEFDTEFGERARTFLTRKLIEAESRPEKQSAAFCVPLVPCLQPVIFLNYNDTVTNMFSLAHELGHALHYFYAGEQQTLFTYDVSQAIAESASIFCTLLVTDKLVTDSKDVAMKKKCLALQIEDIINSTYLQILYILFEKQAHKMALTKKLSADELTELWDHLKRKLYQDSVKPSPFKGYGWMGMRYFFSHHFLCTIYAFGQLFAIGLYQQYLDDREEFIPKYKDLLRTGGKLPPRLLAEKMGLDLTEASFWQNGFHYLETLMNDLEKIVTTA